MIRRVRIQNFGSLRETDVTLGPLTLLLGPNASGKSTFIRALRALTKLLRSPIRGQRFPGGRGEVFTLDHVPLDDLVFSGDSSLRIGLSVWLDRTDGQPSYSLELGKVDDLWSVTAEKIAFGEFVFDSTAGAFEFPTMRRGTIRWSTPGMPPRHASLPFLLFPYRSDRMAMERVSPVLALSSAIGVAYGYRINPTDLTTPILPPWIDPSSPYADSTGTGFVHTLREWAQSIKGKETFDEKVLPSLRTLFPHIRGIGFRASGNLLFLEYRTDRSSRGVPAVIESDGVNMAVFFLTIPYLIEKPGVEAYCIGLEEPEAGTHPFLQAERLELFRRFTSGDPGTVPMQIVATTHSPELIRWVRRDEAIATLRFVEHLGSGEGTKIYQLGSQGDIDKVYAQYNENPGVAWYSGVFGGNPPKPSTGSG